LLVQVVAGNPATSAGVLLCLNTHDATALRQLHPVLAHTVAGVPWCDMAATIHDVRRWRAALPAAVGASVSWQYRGTFAPLAGLTALNVRWCLGVDDWSVDHLPRTLRHLVVRQCRKLTAAANFTHLSLLTSLDCSMTNVLEEGLERLPPSLQELYLDDSDAYRPPLPTVSFRHLPALRVLTWIEGAFSIDIIATLPPTLEKLDITDSKAVLGIMSLAHLPRSRVFRAVNTALTDATVAALPPSLEELDVGRCRELTPVVSFAHLRVLRTLRARHIGIDDTSLASLSLSLVSLDVSHCARLSTTATLPGLPALQMLDVSDTSIGDTFVASLPPCLSALHIANCAKITPAVDIRHLVALRTLQSSGTNLSPSTVVALRARGCFAPAEPVLQAAAASSAIRSMEALADGGLVTRSCNEGLRRLDMARDGAQTASVKRFGEGVITLLPDGRRLAVGFNNDTSSGIEVWDMHTTPPSLCMALPCRSGVRALAVLRDGTLAAGCNDGHIRLVDVKTGTVSYAPTLRHGQGVTALAVFPDGTLATGSNDKKVQVWDVGRGECLAVMAGHNDVICALAVLASGHLASAANELYMVRLWDAATWTCCAVLASPSPGIGSPLGVYVQTMVALPDGRLACGENTGIIRVWDTTTCLPSHGGDAAIRQRSAASCVVNSVELVGHAWVAYAMTLLPDGRLVSGGSDRVIRVWRLPPLLRDDVRHVPVG